MDVFVGMTVDSNVYDTLNNSFYLGTPGNDCPLPKPFLGRNKRIVADVAQNKTKTEEETVGAEEQEAHKRVFKFVVKNIFANQSLEIPKEALLDKAFEIMFNMSEDFDDVIKL